MKRKIYEMWTVLNYIVLYTITFSPHVSQEKENPSSVWWWKIQVKSGLLR